MSGHTDAPLETVGNLVRTQLTHGGFLVADCRDAHGQPHSGEARSNARLFAMAPQLLAFAQGFIDNVDEWEGEPTPGMRWYAEYVAAKELVASAAGSTR